MPGYVSILSVFPDQPRRRELPVADALAERSAGNDAKRQIETRAGFC
jgi:hypothetical protein